MEVEAGYAGLPFAGGLVELREVLVPDVHHLVKERQRAFDVSLGQEGVLKGPPYSIMLCIVVRVISSRLYPEAIVSDGRHNGLRAVTARGIVDAFREIFL
jgi:hypothetical protein